ncbi:hypothetical protein SDC9_175461 [bioreactor metagenome]|uniref:Uncharacterized protein n=1 Tax=bioreactor metagenome TaxID=1076179 RepID=A0A645GVG6_9ZZZZ
MKLQNDFESLVKYCQSKMNIPIVNLQILEMLDKEEADASKAKEANEIDEDTYADIMEGIKTNKHWTNILKELSVSLSIEFDFLIVFQKKFSSSFKSTVGEIPIWFPNISDDSSVAPFKDVVATLEPSVKRASNFFHIFYRSNGTINATRKKEIVNAIAEKIIAGCTT